MERLTRPLFRLDPGWLFIAAGLVLCAAGVLLPAQADLRALQAQLEQLQGEEVRAYARLKAHSDFMDQVDRADPALIRRLAAAQLNMVPEGDTPVLLAASATSPVTHWIEAAVQVDIRPAKTAPISMLSGLASGPHRLWMFGGGIMCVFIGLILGPSAARHKRDPNGEQTTDNGQLPIYHCLLPMQGAIAVLDDPESSAAADDVDNDIEVGAMDASVVVMDLDRSVPAESELTLIPVFEVKDVEPKPISPPAIASQEIELRDSYEFEADVQPNYDDVDDVSEAAPAATDDFEREDEAIAEPPQVLVIAEDSAEHSDADDGCDDEVVDDDFNQHDEADHRHLLTHKNRLRHSDSDSGA